MTKEHQKSEKSPEQDSPAVSEEQKTEIKAPAAKDAECQRLQKELSEYKDKYLRLVADFENTRKRQERERAEYIKFANEGLIVQFLDILDDLERTVQVAESNHQDDTAFLKGVEMVMAHIYELLKKNQVRPMEAEGKKFDPHLHEILMQIESEEYEDGMVVEEFQKGYFLGDKVVRTAKVKVAVNSGATPEENEQSTKEPEN